MFDRILDGDTAALAEVGRDAPGLERVLRPLLSLNGQSSGFLRNQKALLARDMPEIVPPLEDFLGTVALLDDLNIKYRINIASGTGFEYYTGVIFQFFTGGEKVGGGGRYDALIPAMGGGDVPASGFALYLDSLMGRVKTETLAGPVPRKVLIKVSGGGSANTAFKAADALRGAGIIAVVDLDGDEAVTRWVLEAGDKAPPFTLIDSERSSRTDFSSVADVIKRLEAAGAD
jgi:histidyl-tRNA synthetase